MAGGTGSRAQVDWSIIFDLIASEYGYTWEQFTGLTYKLLEASLESIARRTHNKNAVLAAMHGIKLELYHQRPKPPSKQQLEQARNSIQQTLKEKQAALKNGKRQ